MSMPKFLEWDYLTFSLALHILSPNIQDIFLTVFTMTIFFNNVYSYSTSTYIVPPCSCNTWYRFQTVNQQLYAPNDRHYCAYCACAALIPYGVMVSENIPNELVGCYGRYHEIPYSSILRATVHFRQLKWEKIVTVCTLHQMSSSKTAWLSTSECA